MPEASVQTNIPSNTQYAPFAVDALADYAKIALPIVRRIADKKKQKAEAQRTHELRPQRLA